MAEEQSEIQKAKALLDADRTERATKFQEELNALMEKYQVTIQPMIQIVAK